MNRIAPAALATLLAVTAFTRLHAQTAFTPPQPSGRFTDPANLSGERVRPLDGRELPIDRGALGLEELLRKLSTRASILNIVAHPDDEDGGMLTLYARGLGARVADLSLTRGEGGQNAVTGDFEDALGLLRTQELLANDRYTGVTQMFGTEVDFGFSKTKVEAFSKWGHDRVLYDVVRAIRIYRPLVITATFIGNATDGHGQHQVSGEIAQEAFVAAGDPNVFPELTREGILPWQPLKIYARVPTYAISDKGLFDYATNQYIPARFTNYVTGEVSTTPPSADVIVHEGDTDPLLTAASANHADLPPSLTADPTKPLSYVQFARIGLSLQKSQIGPGVRNAPSGKFDVAYHLYGSCIGASSASEKTGLSSASEKICHLDRSLAASSQGAAERPATPPASTNSVILSEGLHASSRAAVEGPATPPASALPTDPSNHDPQQAPTARAIPAQGNDLGLHQEEQRAEGPFYNSALASQPSFFAGIDTSIEGIATLAPHASPVLAARLHKISQNIADAQQLYDPRNLIASVPPLVHAQEEISELKNKILIQSQLKSKRQASDELNLRAWSHEDCSNVSYELTIKEVQLNDALALALGVHLDATAPADNGNISAGSAVPVHVTVSVDSKVPLRFFPILVRNDRRKIINAEIPLEQSGRRAVVENFAFPFPASGVKEFTITTHSEGLEDVTHPYFTRPNIEQPFYDLLQPELRNAPASSAALIVSTGIEYMDEEISVARIVSSGPQSIEITPPAGLSLSSKAQVFPNSANSLNVSATLSFWPIGGTPQPQNIPRNAFSIFPTITVPVGWKASPAGSDGWWHILYRIEGPPNRSTAITANASVTLPNHQTYTEGYRPIGYGDLPRTNFYTPATDRIVPVDLKLPPADKRRIAYLPGTGDDVPSALASIGLNPTILTVADLTPEKLSHFDTVILGVRTYNAHPDLHGAPTQALFDFARHGGNVIVQYQTHEFTAADAPYPLELGDAEKVVDETAPVKLLDPTNPLLTTPNRITSADFNGWIEERGHGFLSSWDPHYTALTETHDPGAPSEHIAPQLPQRGGLITTHLGRGHWTYCAFALYRQLPEAVPGSYRIFVNLLGLAGQP